ncbi:MAG: LON peptidase substrate-binding domain-containing protein, partial [Myxococcota bacterium]
MAETEQKTSDAGALVPAAEPPPAVLPTVLLDDLVPFPGAVLPILLERPERRDAVLHAKANNGFFFLVNRSGGAPDGVTDWPGRDVPDTLDASLLVPDADEPNVVVPRVAHPPEVGEPSAVEELTRSALNPVGVAVRLIRLFHLPDDRLSALVHMMRRAQPVEVLRSEPFPIVRVLYPVESLSDADELEALNRQLRINLRKFLDAHAAAPDEIRLAAANIEGPGALADFVAQHLSRDFQERLSFLAELDLGRRVRHALEITVRELDLLTVGNRITQEIRDKMEKHQRDYFLREQLKAIRIELGEEKDPSALAISELRKKLDCAGLSELARERADEELRRLELVPIESPEHNVVRSYLDWIAALPWSKATAEAPDIDAARSILDADHYGLAEVKDRIIEFLAVRQLNPDTPGSMLCFAGPPGVGKTSLGQSIARATGRKFYRFSVGGMRDESEIKGHRRTYIGAMPGRILQGLKQVQSANPIFMIDEIDKMGSDWRGDPSSAMLEVLDPAQNVNFLD